MITPSSIGLPSKFSRFRDEVRQRETIEKIALCDSRFILLNAPPGTGKTVIGNSLGLLMGYRYLYLTRTKSLQLQNYNDMKSIGMVDIVGHSNYPCSKVTYDDLGELADIECLSRGNNGCLYKPKIDQCLTSDKVSTNYSHWIQFYKSSDPNRLGTFDLLILDEAHTVHNTLSEAASIKVFASQIDRYLSMRTPRVSADLTTWIEWSRIALDKAEDKLEEIKEDRGNRRDLFYLSRLVDNLGRLHTEESFADWVMVPIYDKGVQFKPCNVAAYSEDYLFRGVDKILLMSATLFKDDAKTLGIDSSQSSFFQISSAFDHHRRPVIYYPTNPPVRADRRMNANGRRLWMNQTDKIIQFEGDNSKGIIQSRSYSRAEEISDLSSHGRGRILIHDNNNSTKIIEQYKSASPPCTLISPILEEGVDFPYDLCNYIIIPKIPFLDLRNPYIKALQDRDNDYSNREVCRTITQMALRGMRFSDDWCRIWVTDGHWSWVRKLKWWYGWFRISFTQIEKLSQAPRRPE